MLDDDSEDSPKLKLNDESHSVSQSDNDLPAEDKAPAKSDEDDFYAQFANKIAAEIKVDEVRHNMKKIKKKKSTLATNLSFTPKT